MLPHARPALPRARLLVCPEGETPFLPYLPVSLCDAGPVAAPPWAGEPVSELGPSRAGPREPSQAHSVSGPGSPAPEGSAVVCAEELTQEHGTILRALARSCISPFPPATLAPYSINIPHSASGL